MHSSSAAAMATSTSAYANAATQREAARTKVAVIGAGFLGKCIAIDLSLLGVQVLVCDTNAQSAAALSSFAYELLNPLLYLGYVTKSMVTQACSNIKIVSDVQQCADASLVIEAIPENLDAKIKLFKSLEGVCSGSTVLATSTKELSIDHIQRELRRPEQFLGVRFFHPCVLVRPVEISLGAQTAQHTVDRTVSFLMLLDKVPHRGPTKRVLSNKEISAFQFNTAVRGNFYHGLLAPKPLAVDDIIRGEPGSPLLSPNYNTDTTTL